MWNRLGKATVLCAMLCTGATAAGCAANGAAGSDYCLLTEFIWLSPRDSGETAQQVVLHNQRREALCGATHGKTGEGR